MRLPLEKAALLDQGGKPTVRELLASLLFNPLDGTIRLNGERVVMQRAAVGVELRRALIDLLGPSEARIFLLRLGFFTGRADARFVRTRWPNLEACDAFTAGTRLHTFSGVVRVETAHFQLDLSKRRFSAEFIWHDSVEAEEFRRPHQHAGEPVCWTQLGYASGYASEFFDDLVVYKETQCRGEGHDQCRVVGKPADVWGAGDAEVILYRERIAISAEQQYTTPRRRPPARVAGAVLSDLDRLIVAPVRGVLDHFAPMALPVLIEGELGSGRNRAAHYLHQMHGISAGAGAMREIDGNQVDDGICSDLSRSVRRGRRSAVADAILIDGVERIPIGIQAGLARAIEEGMRVGGPRVFLSKSVNSDAAALQPRLWYAVSALRVSMPSLRERPTERLAIARALLPVLAARMAWTSPRMDASAARVVEHADWPGNLHQMRSVLSKAIAAHVGEGPLTGSEIERALDLQEQELQPSESAPDWIGKMLATGSLAIADLEGEIYRAAIERAGGNLSAAARLLGLSRAQLAYRIGKPR